MKMFLNQFSSVYQLAKFDLKLMYFGTFLGVLWSILKPAIQISVLSFIFGKVVRFDIPDYPLYLMSGYLSWQLILDCLNTGQISLMKRSHVLKRTKISMLIFPIADMFGKLLLFFISFLSMYAVLILLFKQTVHPTVLLTPIALIPLIVFCFTAGSVLSFLLPYFEDVGYLVTVLLGILYWTVPIIYPIEAIDQKYAWFFDFHPLYWLIKPVQDVIYFGQIPSTTTTLKCLIFVGALVPISLFIISKLKKRVIFYI